MWLVCLTPSLSDNAQSGRLRYVCQVMHDIFYEVSDMEILMAFLSDSSTAISSNRHDTDPAIDWLAQCFQGKEPAVIAPQSVHLSSRDSLPEQYNSITPYGELSLVFISILMILLVSGSMFTLNRDVAPYVIILSVE